MCKYARIHKSDRAQRLLEVTHTHTHTYAHISSHCCCCRRNYRVRIITNSIRYILSALKPGTANTMGANGSESSVAGISSTSVDVRMFLSEFCDPHNVAHNLATMMDELSHTGWLAGWHVTYQLPIICYTYCVVRSRVRCVYSRTVLCAVRLCLSTECITRQLWLLHDM